MDARRALSAIMFMQALTNAMDVYSALDSSLFATHDYTTNTYIHRQY